MDLSTRDIVGYLNLTCGPDSCNPPEGEHGLIACPNPSPATLRMLRFLEEDGMLQARYSLISPLLPAPILVIDPATVVLPQLREAAEHEIGRLADLTAAAPLVNKAIENRLDVAFTFVDGALEAPDLAGAEEISSMRAIYGKLAQLEGVGAIGGWGFETDRRLVVIRSADPVMLATLLEATARTVAPPIQPLSDRHARARVPSGIW